MTNVSFCRHAWIIRPSVCVRVKERERGSLIHNNSVCVCALHINRKASGSLLTTEGLSLLCVYVCGIPTDLGLVDEREDDRCVSLMCCSHLPPYVFSLIESLSLSCRSRHCLLQRALRH